MKHLNRMVAVLAFSAGSTLVATSGDVVVSPDNKGVFIDKFFKDYKSSANPNPGNAALDDLFIEDELNGIRTPIWGNINQPAHPAAGQVIGSYYTAHVDTILRARQRNPDLIVFASKKLNGDDSFPVWTKDANGVIPDQYAMLLADYIEYMNTQGIEIDVLGIDNERTFNEGNITASRHKDIVDELEALSVSRGFTMPLIIGHEDYGPRNSWMSDLITNGWGDRLDIYGTHYYPHLRPLSSLQTDLAWAGDREKWHTELHWDNKEADDMDEAEEAICALWDCTDNGMNGLMWWSYSRTGFRGSIMRAFSVPLVNAYALEVDDVDGEGISTLGKLQTRAFLKGNQLTVFAVNNNTVNSYPSQLFRIDSGSILSDVAVLQWTGTSQTSGTPATVVPLDTRSFEFTLPARSITSFTFTFAPAGLTARYALEGDGSDTSGNDLDASLSGGVDFPPGRKGFGARFSAAEDRVNVPMASSADWLAGFSFKTDLAATPLVSGDQVSLSLAGSNAVFAVGTNQISSWSPLNDGRWHHVAAERRFDDGSLRLYIDGRLEAYGPGDPGTLQETNLAFGGSAGLQIDEIELFNRPWSTNDFYGYDRPSMVVTTGGSMEERNAVGSFVALTRCNAGRDYPYVDLVEDDGTWLAGYNGTTARPIQVSDDSNPNLQPHAGTTFFDTTTGSWWRGRCKPQLDNLLVEAGTYTVSFYVGDADPTTDFYSIYKDPESGNHVGLTATDSAFPVLPDMNTTADSLIHTLDTNVTTAFSVAAVPGDGEWVNWTIEYTVPTNSPLIGRQLGFLFRKPSNSDPQATASFDGPLTVGFVPAFPVTDAPMPVEIVLADSTATAGTDYLDAIPNPLVEGTNSLLPVVDLVEEGDEVVVGQVQSSADYFIAGAATNMIELLDHPMDGWRATEFGTNATNPAVAGDGANPDDDHLTNEQEWALVTDPQVADVPAMNPTISEPNFIISYDQRIDSGFAIGVRWSWSLTEPDWRTDGMTVVPIGLNGDVETLAAILPLTGTNRFIHLEISE